MSDEIFILICIALGSDIGIVLLPWNGNRDDILTTHQSHLLYFQIC